MLGAIYNGGQEILIHNLPLRGLKENEVLIKINSATICGTDVLILDGKVKTNKPVVIGHEFAGYVEEVGKEVFACEEGDLVTVEPHIFCGVCKFCRIGKIQKCLNKKAFGVHLNGGFAQYVIVPQDTVYKVPNSISPEEAALTENVGCCMHGIQRAAIEMGDTVVVLGGGFVGILLAQLAKKRGASLVIVSEPHQQRRDIVQKRGADLVIDPFNDSIEEVVMDQTGGLGADLVIEAAGRRETAKQALQLVSKCGTVMFYGIVPPGEKIEIEPNIIFEHELKIIGSNINPFQHYRTVQLLPDLDLKELITHTFSLNEIMKGIAVARNGEGLKVCIKPNQ
jgi:L-iditol 2-dehydrogenase